MNAFICPKHKKELFTKADSMQCLEDCLYPIKYFNKQRVVDFSNQISLESNNENKLLYQGADQSNVYKNYLEWLFSTFMITEEDFRKQLWKRLNLRPGERILITGCGNGDDVLALAQNFADLNLEIHAQDINAEMIYYAADVISKIDFKNITFSISDAIDLPYADNFFDVSFHFGGINFMPDVEKAISEMTRVTKDGGIVAFGDEGIAPWLQQTEYYKMMVENNSLWASSAPLKLLPSNANHVNVSWILENCFYFIDFIKDKHFPAVNIDVPHKGTRGGSIRTRYYGKIEGVSEKAKAIVIERAKKEGMSTHHWLDKLIKESK